MCGTCRQDNRNAQADRCGRLGVYSVISTSVHATAAIIACAHSYIVIFTRRGRFHGAERPPGRHECSAGAFWSERPNGLAAILQNAAASDIKSPHGSMPCAPGEKEWNCCCNTPMKEIGKTLFSAGSGLP